MSSPGLPPLPRVAVVGATGLVGEVLLEVLEQRDFPVAELRPLAGARAQGRSVTFRGRTWPVREAGPEAFEGVDLVFFAATGELSRSLAPEAVQRGALVIDKSSTWRMHPTVPLVVPEINPEAATSHAGLLACPNCTTIGLVLAIEPLRRAAGLGRVRVTTFQAVSGAGRAGLEELAAQARDASRGAEAFARRIEGNVLAWCEGSAGDGYSTEERKLRDETRKILALPDLDLTATCVRVPVPVGHCGSVWVETERPLPVDEARAALRRFPGVKLVDDQPELVPIPDDVRASDEVWIGRVRADETGRGLWLWQVSNNLRKGAATNAVQTAELLLPR
jgi:aspartate-semialdehyde dehydrogenase